MPELQIPASEAELAVQIMREVAQWCIDIGKPMWALEELTQEKLLSGPLSSVNFVVARFDGSPAASMILQWHDPAFWPAVKENESAFIHKLCVRRNFAGRNLSTKMVGYAVSESKKKLIEYVRLDTDFANPRLCSLYEGMGFVKAGRKRVNGRDYALYELQVSGFKPNWPRMRVV
jgi:ribosomal protein S18 acetylase RimI-like enzyme